VVAVAFPATNEKVADVEDVVDAGPERMFTVGPGVTVHGYDAVVESEPDVAVTVNMCAPGAIPMYAAGVVHGTGAFASIEQASADAFAAEKEKDAEVDVVVAAGPERIVTDGGEAGGGAAAETVHVTSACAEPLAFATRMARVWVPAERPVRVDGEVQAQAGGWLSSAHVVVVAPCEVHPNVAVVDDVVAGGCWTRVIVGRVAAVDTAA
jgi:hypothetical protein